MSVDPDLSGYYDKIAQIRSRILSKHKPSNPNKEAEFSFSMQPPNPISFQSQHISSNETVNRPNVTSRVRKLEDINDRIKNILGEKKLNKIQSIQKNSQHNFSPLYLQSEPKQRQQQIKNTYKIPQPKPYMDRENPLRKKLFEDQNKPTQITQSYRQTTTNAINVKRQQSKPSQSSSYNQQRQAKPAKNLADRILHKRSQSIQFTEQTNIPADQTKSQTIKLIRLLVKQIQLDSQLREWKQKFDNFKDSHKQEDLLKLLRAKGINLTKQQLAQLVQISTQQRNPFLDLKTCREISLQSFANHILLCKNHWQTAIKQSVSIQKLQKQYFSIQDIDIQGKGHISVQDLVCYINLNSQKYLRNRDVYSLVRRFQAQQRQCQGKGIISYRAFLNYLTKA